MSRKRQSPESAIVKECLEYLQILGIFAWRNNSGALRNETGRLVRYGKAGSSDIIGILPGGNFLAVECKTPGGRISELQENFLDTIESEGGTTSRLSLLDSLKNSAYYE